MRTCRTVPEIFPAFTVLSFGVLHDAADQFQDVVLTADVAEGVISHGFPEIDGVQDFNLIPAPLQHLSAFQNHSPLRH